MKIPLLPRRSLLVLSALLAAIVALPADAKEKAKTKAKEKPKAAPVKENEKVDPLIMTRLQVWLDRQGFGPGKIDGLGGEFTTKALALYKEAHPGITLEKNEAPADFTEPPTVDYTLREEDWQQVGDLAPTLEEQAKQKAMPYPMALDFIIERFHCDEDLLRKLNPDFKPETFKAGSVVKVPNVVPFEVEKLKPGELERKDDPALKARSIEVDTKENILRVLDNGKLIAAFPITPGSEKLPAPLGTWKVESVVTLPFFRRDEAMLNEGRRSDDAINLPPGPRNPVGVVWMALNKTGIGIHGTDNPATIGRSGSHGCIRLANWDVVKLTTLVTKGATVEIR